MSGENSAESKLDALPSMPQEQQVQAVREIASYPGHREAEAQAFGNPPEPDPGYRSHLNEN